MEASKVYTAIKRKDNQKLENQDGKGNHTIFKIRKNTIFFPKSSTCVKETRYLTEKVEESSQSAYLSNFPNFFGQFSQIEFKNS